MLDDGDGKCVCPQLHFPFALQMVSVKRRTSRPRLASARCFMRVTARSFTKQRITLGVQVRFEVWRGVCVHPKQRSQHRLDCRKRITLAGKPPSGCGKRRAPALRSRREKALAPCRFQTRFEHDRGFIPKPAKQCSTGCNRHSKQHPLQTGVRLSSAAAPRLCLFLADLPRRPCRRLGRYIVRGYTMPRPQAAISE